jgi:endonuclease/exonuclease/phosphatase family metal-dependent hydrolase
MAMTPGCTNGDRVSRLRRAGIALLVAVAVVVCWYGQSRLLASRRCVRIVRVEGHAAGPGDAASLRLAAYNIAHGRGGRLGAGNWTGASRREMLEHLSKIAGQIETSGADVVVLNEVDFDCAWSRHMDQARTIAARAGFSYCVQQRNIDVSFPFMRFRFGNAILSRFPVEAARVVRFPPLSRTEAMLAGAHDGLLATIRTPVGRIRVLGVHLEYRSEKIRVAGARLIKELAGASDIPLVAAGDFNSTPSSATGHGDAAPSRTALDVLLRSGLLTAGETQTDGDRYLTFPSAQPDRAIDWILCTPQLQPGTPTVVRSALSDHLMVVADIGR